MGFKCLLIALALAVCLCITALGEDSQKEDIKKSFQDESLFTIRKDTGMSANAVDAGVRTPVVVVKGVGIAAVAGSWGLTLNDVDKSYLKLDLNQTADAVFGSGVLTTRGISIPVNAGGTVIGNRLALFVVPDSSQNMYRFSMTITAGSMDGDYVFTAPGVTQPGVAFGSLLSPLSAAPAVQQTVPQTAATQPVATAPATP
jgi:hypothetical protein